MTRPSRPHHSLTLDCVATDSTDPIHEEKRMARKVTKTQGNVSTAKLAKATSSSGKPIGVGTKHTQTDDQACLELAMKITSVSHQTWIKSNPSSILDDLVQYLESVREELTEFDYDQPIVEIIDELDVAADYLSDEAIDLGGDLPTVGYRLENLDDDIGHVEKPIARLGATFRAKRLSKRNPKESLNND
jgi:hypothetical protein